MEPWFSGAVVNAVQEAKSRRALFIVYVRDNSQVSQSTDKLWSDVWTKFESTPKLIALRLEKDTEPCTQFSAIYKVEFYPTIYFINGQNGQVLKKIDQPLENSGALQQVIEESLNVVEPKAQQQPPPTTTTKSVEEKVAEARSRLKEIHDKREDEAKTKEREDEINRRRLGQQMLLDKQKKDEEAIRKQAEEIRREKLEQQKLQAKLQAQIQQDREEKRRKYEEEQEPKKSSVQPKTPPTTVVESPKVDYARSRLQFRLTDGSFFTEDFPSDAHMTDVYAYLQEALPRNQYRTDSFTLRTTHTRVTLTRDNPNTLKELELAPSAVLLVLNQGNTNSPPMNISQNNIFQSIPLLFTWLMMQMNFIYQFLSAKLFGQRPAAVPRRSPPPSTAREQSRSTRTTVTKGENFRTDSTEKSTIRRFHNTQDDSDDEEKRTWNGNSTQQM